MTNPLLLAVSLVSAFVTLGVLAAGVAYLVWSLRAKAAEESTQIALWIVEEADGVAAEISGALAGRHDPGKMSSSAERDPTDLENLLRRASELSTQARRLATVLRSTDVPEVRTHNTVVRRLFHDIRLVRADADDLLRRHNESAPRA